MSFKMEIIRNLQMRESRWSGGTTTELAIYPEDAEYAKRNFLWRLSSAVVELEESEFTHLPGIHRLIMVLEGELELRHEGHYSKRLRQYEQDSFSGEWNTKSRGKVRDFNLMMAQGCTGSIEALKLNAGGCSIEDFPRDKPSGESERHTMAYYCLNGNCSYTIEGSESGKLNKGDMLMLNGKAEADFPECRLSNAGEADIRIVKVNIFYCR